METIEESVISQSDDENEMNLTNRGKITKKANIIDSDSDNENVIIKTNVVEMQDSEDSTLNDKPTKSRLKRVAVIDSDSDDEKDQTNSLSVKRHSGVLNSDVEDVVDEEEITPHNKSFPDENTAVQAIIYTTNSKGALITETTSMVTPSLSALCDSDSEEELDHNIIDTTVENLQPRAYKRARKKNTDEPKKMTVKDAAKQRSEIRSESQRMVRCSNVSLPYHKPKSYTITEFLQKRSKLASTLPPIPKASPSVAIKMSKDQLKEVSKNLDARIKEVEEFYKSESDDDEDEENDDATDEIQTWLNELVEKAMDEVEKTEEVVEMETSKTEESLEYDFNLDDSENDALKKSSVTDLIKDKLTLQPKLSGSPDDIIDFDEGVTKVSAVKKLVDKFFQHACKKVPHKHKVELNVVEVGSQGQIIKETVSMNVEEEEEPALVETPGAKLKKLREELQLQMAQKRLEQWKLKHEQGDCLTTEKKEGFEEEAAEKDILDDEEEECEMTESETEEEDDEEEYVEAKPEKKVKSVFVDEEALEDEEMDEGGDESEDDIIENDGGEDGAEDDACDGDVEEPPEDEKLQSPKKKVLKRILKPFSVDSDDEEDQSQVVESAGALKYYTTDEDDFIPPNLPRVGKTPQRTQLDKNKSEFDFLTPVTYLTGLQNLNSDSKFLHDSPTSPSNLTRTQSLETGTQSQVQKQLFSENSEPSQDSQGNFEDLAQLCSGTFPETQTGASGAKSLETEELPSTQDLINLCSGDFSNTNLNKEDKPINHVHTHPDNELKSLDEEQDQIISQLLDEDELERFKKKFESPINPTIRKTQVLEDVEEVNATGLINSDDEGLEIKKKKRTKLVFSDDEDSDDEDVEEDEEEEIDLHDDVDEEQQLEDEIVAQESHGYKISDFLDKEAELSESEWGSADEDEKGLDELEVEQGDEEKFNENKVRSELERIHMRQLLDEDNREVKLLQELLLEDGELHGTGRKRQFKWKTLDSADDSQFEKRDDDDIYLDEEETEEHWRKMRHKREMFLKKKSGGDDEDNILSDSDILKIGQQVLKTKSLSSQNSTPTNKEETKEPFNLLNKRGSFLSRSDQVLQRLAEYNKVTTSVGNSAKNSKCFVFQTVDSSVVKDNNNKRKATESTPNVIKKLRLDDLSPAIAKKSAGKNSKAKKLFGNW